MTPEELSPLKKINTENIINTQEKINELTLEKLDNEPGFYQSTMKSMLLPGHEGELCNYLKEMGLIQRSVRCQGSLKVPTCTTPMKWTQARIVDKYTWKCSECSNKCSIREDSFFKLTKCSLMSTIRILLGWCKNCDADEIANILNMKVHPIKKLYDACCQVIEAYVKNKPNDWKIGGDNVVVLFDIYPEGCAKLNGTSFPESINNNTTQILCLAEAKAIPTQYWFHVIRNQNKDFIKNEILEVIRTMVRPGSVLVSDQNGKVCSYDDLIVLKEYMHTTVEKLAQFNRPADTILQILDTIWTPALDICREAQYYPIQLVQGYLYNQLWRRRFAKTPSSALEYFLHHIADHYPLTRLYLAGLGSQRSIGEELGVEQSTVSLTFSNVFDQIVAQAGNWIKFLTSQNLLVEVKKMWQRKYRFPTAVGVIDCAHIGIEKPKIHGDEYVNRKGKPMLNV